MERSRQSISRWKRRRSELDQTSIHSDQLLIATPSERIVEFFDMRATEEAIRALQGAPLLGGHLELQWAWDATP